MIAIGGLDRQLAQAADDRLTKVVALVDGMAHRGAADALIQPLRGRLAELAPARPIKLARLLFRPLEPIITPDCGGLPNACVPRRSLGIIGDAILERLGPIVAELEPLIAGCTWDCTARASSVGALLWPAAAAILPSLPLPAAWSETGLPAETFPSLRSVLTAILEHGALLEAWPRIVDDEQTPSVIRHALSATQARYPQHLGTILTLLLANGAVASTVLSVAGCLPPATTETALKQALAQTERTLAGGLASLSLSPATERAIQALALIEALEQASSQPAIRSLAQHTRSLAEQACRGRMLQALDRHILPALTEGSAADGPALESYARDVRRLGLVGRRCGTASVFDKLLSRTAAGICAAPNPTLSAMDRLRLAELLVGAEEALSLVSMVDA